MRRPIPGAPIATITKRMHNPDGLAFDASGDLWVAMLANNTVVEYAPPYTRTPIAILSNRIKGPTDLTFGAR
jgi:sugar lactone lactonase YvrE